MKKILCDDQKTGINETCDIVHALHYFTDVVQLFEDRHISKYTLTQSSAERLRVLLEKVRKDMSL